MRTGIGPREEATRTPREESSGLGNRRMRSHVLGCLCAMLILAAGVGSTAIQAAPIEEDDIYLRSSPSNNYMYVEYNVDSYDCGSTVSKYFYIWNAGDGTLDWSLSDNRGWLTLSPTSGSSTGEQDRVNVTVSVAGKSAGFFQIATIAMGVDGTGVTNIGQFWLRVHEMVEPDGPLHFNSSGGNPPPQTFQFGLNGKGWENWTASDSASWLTVSPTSGTVSTNAPLDTLTASVDTSSLGPGTYTATITLSSYTQSYRQARMNYRTTLDVTLTIENSPPIAVDDSASCNEDESITGSVTFNDSDPDGDSLSVQSLGSPSHGSAAMSGPKVVYTPDPDFCGLDSFTYTVTDGHGGTDTATVSVTVNCVNDPPKAVNDSGSCTEDSSASISVLSNDSDPDGDTLTIQSVGSPGHGSAVKSGSSITYTPGRTTAEATRSPTR